MFTTYILYLFFFLKKANSLFSSSYSSLGHGENARSLVQGIACLWYLLPFSMHCAPFFLQAFVARLSKN